MVLTSAARSRRGSAIAAVGLIVGLTACGSSEAGGTEGSSLVASTSIWADVASEVFCGAEVVAVVPAGADPHSFEPSLQDRAMIEDADLVIMNGGGLEGALEDLIETGPAAFVEVLDHVGDAAEPADHDDDEHDHGGVDPHVWQDPTIVAAVLDEIADAGSAVGLDDCSGAYGAELRRLDADIAALIDALPASRRVMVTSHDALGYFADRYGLDIVGTVIPANNTLAETNAADLAALADVIEQRDVTVVFTEELESTVDADALADRLGIAVVPLVTDALTDDPATDTYLEMMRSNASMIATALSP
ncbi:MAG: zinc ABC transporter substrate-binding protein [Ilumatobacter sp.]|nr:zinc ABC transporter substrate-binding protein [Ilumatobacter sp.]